MTVLRPDGALWLNIGDTFNTRTAIRPSSHQAGLGHATDSTRASFADRHWDSEYRYRHYHVCDRGCTQLQTCRYHEALTAAQRAADEWRA